MRELPLTFNIIQVCAAHYDSAAFAEIVWAIVVGVVCETWLWLKLRGNLLASKLTVSLSEMDGKRLN